MTAQVLVTDAEYRSALGACRALADAGYRVATVAGRRARSSWSRVCNMPLAAPNPLSDPDGFVDRLVEILASRSYDVLIPSTDASLRAVSEQRNRLEPLTRLGLPAHECVLRSLDKVLLLELAEKVGLAAPPSIVCANLEEAQVAASTLGFPVLLKPLQSVFRLGSSYRQRSISVVRDADELAGTLPEYGGRVVVQRFENATSLVSCTGVVGDRALLAVTVSRVLRTFPPRAGSHSSSVTIEPPPELVERVLGYVRAAGWQGIFQAQLLEAAGGRFSLIDFNPRLFASITLDAAAGASLPAIWCDWLRGRDVVVPVRGRPGFRYRWEPAELYHVFWHLRRGELTAACRMLQPRRGTTWAIFRLADPGPFVYFLLELARYGLWRLGRRSPVRRWRHAEWWFPGQ
jgi:predicted ATP-grasp superfamily ATP-dependent carboligase